MGNYPSKRFVGKHVQPAKCEYQYAGFGLRGPSIESSDSDRNVPESSADGANRKRDISPSSEDQVSKRLRLATLSSLPSVDSPLPNIGIRDASFLGLPEEIRTTTLRNVGLSHSLSDLSTDQTQRAIQTQSVQCRAHEQRLNEQC